MGVLGLGVSARDLAGVGLFPVNAEEVSGLSQLTLGGVAGCQLALSSRCAKLRHTAAAASNRVPPVGITGAAEGDGDASAVHEEK
jgi:hypothetical protein